MGMFDNRREREPTVEEKRVGIHMTSTSTHLTSSIHIYREKSERKKKKGNFFLLKENWWYGKHFTHADV